MSCLQQIFLPVAIFFVSGISNWSSRNGRQKMVRQKDFLDYEWRKRNTAQEKRMDEFNNTIWICPHPKVKSNAFSLYCFYDLKRDLVVRVCVCFVIQGRSDRSLMYWCHSTRWVFPQTDSMVFDWGRFFGYFFVLSSS